MSCVRNNSNITITNTSTNTTTNTNTAPTNTSNDPFPRMIARVEYHMPGRVQHQAACTYSILMLHEPKGMLPHQSSL